MIHFYVYKKTLKPTSSELAFYSHHKGIAGFYVKQDIKTKYFLGKMTERELTNLCCGKSKEKRAARIVKSRKNPV